MADLTQEELERARDLGAATYLSAYLHLMARAIGVDDSDDEAINALAVRMIEPMQIAVHATWCALMTDRVGMQDKLTQFRFAVEALP